MSLPRKNLKGWGLILGLVAPLVVAGCGPSTATVSGKVSYKGIPLKGGSVTFVCQGKPSVSGPIAEDGSYTLEKVPTGEVKICVDTRSLKPAPGQPKAPTYKPPAGQEAPGGYNPTGSGDQSKRYVAIPEEYAEPDKTTLTYTVTTGPQTYDIQLK